MIGAAERHRRWSWVIGLLAVFAVACSGDEGDRGLTQNTDQNTEENVEQNTEENVAQNEGEPQLDVSGEEDLSWVLEFESTEASQFAVSNIGEGILEFEIDSPSWLSMNPVEDRAEADETVLVEAEASCTKYHDDERVGEVEITSNGGDHDFEVDLYCGEVLPGTLQVDVQGLPDGLAHDIDVVDQEDGEVQSLPDDGEMLLAPGTYDIDPEPVEDGLAEYDAEGPTADIETDATTAVVVEYELVPAELPVAVEGLPGGVEADVELVGDDESHTVTESETVELTHGVYEVDVQEVGDDTTVHEPAADNPGEVTVASGTNDELVVEYQLVDAELEVEIIGELGGYDADVDVTGPDGFSEHLTETEALEDLAPGEYTVEPDDVGDSPSTYTPDGDQTVDLESGDEETVTVEYQPATGDIEVDFHQYGEVDYEIELVGPDGFSHLIEDDESFSAVSTGSYEVVVNQQAVDPFGNDSYIEIAPEDFELEGGDDQVVDVQVRAAYIVITEADAGPGSLRFVVDDVLDGTVVQFIDDVQEVTLDGDHILVDSQIAVAGRSDADPVAVDGDESTRLFRVEDGAELTLSDLVLRDGYDDDPGAGGAALVVGDGSLIAERVVFEENVSTQAGGALAAQNEATLVIADSVFAKNTTGGWGSAIDVPQHDNDVDIDIRRSLFRDNVAEDNGGTVDTSGTLEIQHSTFAHNESAGRAAGVLVFDGQARLEGLTVVDNHVEISDNHPESGGVYVNVYADATIRASVVTDNHGGDVGGEIENIASAGFNVLGDVQDPQHFDEEGSDQLGVDDAGLESLADNGGATETIALADQSPARAVMFGKECHQNAELGWTDDQRGAHRPAGAFCSAGACEIDATVETFEGADMSRTDFEEDIETFTGVDAIEWDYQWVKRQQEAEGDEDAIDATSVVLKGDEPGWIAAQDVSGDLASISVMAAPAGDGDDERRVEIFVDGESVGQSPDVSEWDEPGVYAVELDEEVDGPFDVTVEATGAGDVAVDNLSWR